MTTKTTEYQIDLVRKRYRMLVQEALDPTIASVREAQKTMKEEHARLKKLIDEPDFPFLGAEAVRRIAFNNMSLQWISKIMERALEDMEFLAFNVFEIPVQMFEGYSDVKMEQNKKLEKRFQRIEKEVKKKRAVDLRIGKEYEKEFRKFLESKKTEEKKAPVESLKPTPDHIYG